jgi:hypothetical protein
MKNFISELKDVADSFFSPAKAVIKDFLSSPEISVARETLETEWQNLKDKLANHISTTESVAPDNSNDTSVDPTILVKGRKNNQPDWEVYYYNKEENIIQVMAIFGVPSIGDAIKEAHYSLGAFVKDWYVIIRVEQIDIDYSLLDQGVDLAALSEILLNKNYE